MNSDTRNALIQFFKTLIVETYDCSRKEHKKKILMKIIHKDLIISNYT